MLPSSQDKKMLIQSMKKLTNHISNNSIRQKQIFDSLSKNDLLKIISNMSDDNEYLRRISGLLIAELFYNNDQIKQKAIKLLEISPGEGRICLNPIPSPIQKYPSTFKKCIQLMKSPFKQEESDKFCWTINLDRKILQIQFLQYKKYSSFTFLDPNRNIFGFTFIGKDKREALRKQTHNKSKQKSVRSIDSNLSSKRESLGMNSSFYKNYIQTRNRKAQSPSSYRDYYERKQGVRPSTSRNHKNDYSTNLHNPGSNKNINTIHSISQYAKLNKEYDYSKLNTPNKNKETNLKLEMNSLNHSLDLGGNSNGSTTLRTPVGSAHKQSYKGYRAPQTDRKPENTYKYKMSDSGIHNSSTAQKLKYPYPESAKNSYINQHQKFYKRVKQILKR